MTQITNRIEQCFHQPNPVSQYDKFIYITKFIYLATPQKPKNSEFESHPRIARNVTGRLHPHRQNEERREL